MGNIFDCLSFYEKKLTILRKKERSLMWNCIKIAKTTSTNSHIKESINCFEPYTVLWTENQTAGRGRYKRAWNAVAGKDLTFSFLLPLNDFSENLWSNISQICAYTLLETLQENRIDALLKWPNDILIRRKKVAGILCESIQKGNEPFLIGGIGLNVNSTKDEHKVITQPATSLFEITQKKFNLEQFLHAIIVKLEQNTDTLKTTGFSPFVFPLNNHLAYKGEYKTFLHHNEKKSAIIKHVNSDGTLQIQYDSGENENINAGEISFSNQ